MSASGGKAIVCNNTIALLLFDVAALCACGCDVRAMEHVLVLQQGGRVALA